MRPLLRVNVGPKPNPTHVPAMPSWFFRPQILRCQILEHARPLQRKKWAISLHIPFRRMICKIIVRHSSWGLTCSFSRMRLVYSPGRQPYLSPSQALSLYLLGPYLIIRTMGNEAIVNSFLFLCMAEKIRKNQFQDFVTSVFTYIWANIIAASTILLIDKPLENNRSWGPQLYL